MLKVIVLEDEPMVRRELVLLTPWDDLGIIFSGEASNGCEGLALAEKVRPDIVVTDIRMPGMDGLGFITELEARFFATGVAVPEFIILSGFSEFEYARSAIRLGVSEYLLKPVSDDDLRAALVRAKGRILSRSERNRTEKALFAEYGAGDGKAPADGYVEATVRILKDRYIQGVTIEDAASEIGLSAGHLSRLFKQETGYTFVDYLMHVRVKRAAELLRDPTVKIYEVADLVGYSDARYFAQVFRKLTGLTPKEFRDDTGHTDRSISQE